MRLWQKVEPGVRRERMRREGIRREGVRREGMRREGVRREGVLRIRGGGRAKGKMRK